MKPNRFRAIFVFLNLIIVFFLVFLAQSQTKGYLNLRKDDGKLFMENLKHSFENYLISKDKTQAIYADRLRAAAQAIVLTHGDRAFTRYSLAKLANQFNIFRLVVLSPQGNILATNRGFGGKKLAGEFSDVIKGKEDFATGDLRMNLFRTGFRFVVAKHIPARGALILIDEGSDLQTFFNTISFEHIFKHLEHNRGLCYLSFENQSNPAIPAMSVPSDFNVNHVIPESDWVKHSDPESNMRMRMVQFMDESALEFLEPVHFNGAQVGNLRIGLSLTYMKSLQQRTLLTVFLGALLLLGLNILFFFSNRLLHRINREGNRFRWVLEELKDGITIEQPGKPILQNNAFSDLVPPEKLAEIEHLPTGITQQEWDGRMFLILKNRFQDTTMTLVRDTTLFHIAEESRSREEKLFSMGQLTSAFAHEVRNPLNTISMSLQQVETQSLAPDDAELLSIMKGEIQRLNRTVQEFLQVSKQPALKISVFKLSGFLHELAAFYKVKLQEKQAVLSLDIQDVPQEIQVDRDQIRGVLVNLIENSLQADATILSLKTFPDNGFLVIELVDNGRGMDEATRKKAFDLYFTTRSEGSGLGLAHAHRVISAHNGFIRLHSEKDQGTRIEIYIPMEIHHE